MMQLLRDAGDMYSKEMFISDLLYYTSIHYLPLIQGRVVEAAGLDGYSRPPFPQQRFPVLPSRSWGVPRPDGIHNPSSELWVYPRVSSQLVMPRSKGAVANSSPSLRLSPTEETHFGRLCPRSYSFSHYPQLMAIGEGRNIDGLINW